jgi:hypothetical protein
MRKFGWVSGVVLVLGLVGRGHAQGKSNPAAGFVAELVRTGVSPHAIRGTDAYGVPVVCSQGDPGRNRSHRDSKQAARALPTGSRGWECIPGVIRNDGVDTFRVEVDVNGAVNEVTLDAINPLLVAPQTPPVVLRDDGTGGDLVAGDLVYTSGDFRFDTSQVMSPHYQGDSNSPAGLDFETVGLVTIDETNGTSTSFLLDPEIGLLDASLPGTFVQVPDWDVAYAPNVVNVRTNDRNAQRFLRGLGGDLRDVTNLMYTVLPDRYHFCMLFSTNKVERLPRVSSANFFAGNFSNVRRDFTGTGGAAFDDSASYGSDGELLSVNVLDSTSRGIASSNAMHEVTHQWSAHTSATLGINDATGHYNSQCSAASLVGGFAWIANGDGTFTLDCDQGRNGSHNAPPLDKYFAGLIDGGLSMPSACGTSVAPEYTVTIGEIQALHGVRSPGPATTQRDFNVAFVAESHGRLLNNTEMTFYQILAEHFAKSVPAADPDPYLGFNWVSVDRYFGEGTTWNTTLQPTPPPALIGIADGLGVTGSPSAFISPVSADVDFTSIRIEVSEPIDLVAGRFTIDVTGGTAPTGMTLVTDGPDHYRVDLNGPVPQREWTTIVFTVRNTTGALAEWCLQLAHLPCDVNGDGNVGLGDASAYVNEVHGANRAALVDINQDGAGGLADTSAWVNNFHGQTGLPAANGTMLPNRPSCP